MKKEWKVENELRCKEEVFLSRSPKSRVERDGDEGERADPEEGGGGGGEDAEDEGHGEDHDDAVLVGEGVAEDDDGVLTPVEQVHGQSAHGDGQCCGSCGGA